MKDFFTIIEIIKEIKGLKYYRQVAELLGMDYDTLITKKRRNSIPFEIIIDFCQKENISLRKIFYGEDMMVETPCTADDDCKELCNFCMSLPDPDNKKKALRVLREIFASDCEDDFKTKRKG